MLICAHIAVGFLFTIAILTKDWIIKKKKKGGGHSNLQRRNYFPLVTLDQMHYAACDCFFKT